MMKHIATLIKFRSCLFILFLVSLLTRLVFFYYFTQHGTNAWIYVDSDQYLSIAKNLIVGNGFCLEPGIATAYRLPGYPLFLAACFKLFGVHIIPALLLQIVLASLIPILVFFVSLSLLPDCFTVAMIASVAAALHPGFIVYAGMLATESLCVLFLLIFFLFLFRGLKQSQPWYWWCVGGMCLGVASLLRPVGHYVLVVAIVMFLLVRVRGCIPLIFGWLLIVIPWLIRNALLFGGLLFHTLPGLHFLQYVATPIVVQTEHCSYPQARACVLNEWNQRIELQAQMKHHSLNEYERCRIGESLAFEYVKAHPVCAGKYACTEMFKTVAGLYSAIILLADGAAWPDYGERATWLAKVQRFLMPQVQRKWLIPFIYYEILFLFIMLLGFCIFLVRIWRNILLWSVATKILPFIILFIGLTLAYGGARLRMPADPLLLLGAVYGLWYRSHE